ncbi:hypothetical protein QJS10_CPA16g00815 [Acorus calamus]|uniref:Cytochrome b-c1 complex subunit Rieske transmembrane domain-containing protein n=1 Tax=Acorus calamus TaxID=4465 RepID=A0AAV9D3S8_ACOCL|nr:hypothetical protein QJS10_CPA16g00815 [Acorus calamus]
MLRIAARRLSSLSRMPNHPTASVFLSRDPISADPASDGPRSDASAAPVGWSSSGPIFRGSFRGFASESLIPTHDMKIPDVPATAAAIRNPTPIITYDEHNHERFAPGDPSKRAFAYFVLSGGRFVYASLIRLLILKFVLSMSASKDVLALASLEVDLSSIEPGTTVTVKWRGKPVFIRRRTEEDINLANSVDVGSLRDPQEDSVRVKNPEWLIVIGVCTHLGCIHYQMQGTLGVGSARAMAHTMIFQVGFGRDRLPTTWRYPPTASWRKTSL